MEIVAVAIRPDSVTGRLASRGSSDSSVAVSRRDVQGLKRFNRDATATAVLAVVAVGSVVALDQIIQHAFHNWNPNLNCLKSIYCERLR